MTLQEVCPTEFPFVICRRDQALIYQRDGVWVVAVGSSIYKTEPGGWRKEFSGRFNTLQDALREAKRLGFGKYRYCNPSSPRTWFGGSFTHEKDWRAIYRGGPARRAARVR